MARTRGDVGNVWSVKMTQVIGGEFIGMAINAWNTAVKRSMLVVNASTAARVRQVLIPRIRIATIIASKDKIISQRFAFLRGCSLAHPPYTPLAILLNRFPARPLVSGEFTAIVLIRDVVLTCSNLGVPLFAVYAITITPLSTPVYTKSVGRVGEYMTVHLETPRFSCATLSDAQVSDLNAGDRPPATPATCFVNSNGMTFAKCLPLTSSQISSMPISFTFPQGINGVQVGVRMSSRITSRRGYGLDAKTINHDVVVKPHPTSNGHNIHLGNHCNIAAGCAGKLQLHYTRFISTECACDESVRRRRGRQGPLRRFQIRWVLDLLKRRVRALLRREYHLFYLRSATALSARSGAYFPAPRAGGETVSESAGIIAFIRQRLMDLDEDPDVEAHPRPLGAQAAPSANSEQHRALEVVHKTATSDISDSEHYWTKNKTHD
ncbi:hypothetical protein C8R44DRAFT_750818 [Mycena epipterygia]|nr:hypothetical protein C8R44DRAFT_750818 [Mycena epipterygia]